MLDLAACVAIGETWLQFPVMSSPVLIVDEESGYRRLSRRLGDVLRGHACDAATPLYYVTLGGFDLGRPFDAQQLQNMIFMTGAKFVLIDALVDVMMGRDENAAQFVQPIFHALRTIADNTQAALVVIHHSAKAGGYRGSSAIKGAVDQMLMVESDPAADAIIFKSDKARDTISPSFGADAHFDTDKFYLTSGQAPQPAGMKINTACEYVLRYLSMQGQTMIEDIVSNADTCSPGQARKAIFTLAKPNMGYIRRANVGGFGIKAEYILTRKGQDYADKMS